MFDEKVYMKEYRKKHKEKIRIQDKEYRLENKEVIRERNKNYHKNSY